MGKVSKSIPIEEEEFDKFIGWYIIHNPYEVGDLIYGQNPNFVTDDFDEFQRRMVKDYLIMMYEQGIYKFREDYFDYLKDRRAYAERRPKKKPHISASVRKVIDKFGHEGSVATMHLWSDGEYQKVMER